MLADFCRHRERCHWAANALHYYLVPDRVAPRLRALHERVEGHPGVKAYFAKARSRELKIVRRFWYTVHRRPRVGARSSGSTPPEPTRTSVLSRS